MADTNQRVSSPTGGQCELLNSSNATTGGTHIANTRITAGRRGATHRQGTAASHAGARAGSFATRGRQGSHRTGLVAAQPGAQLYGGSLGRAQGICRACKHVFVQVGNSGVLIALGLIALRGLAHVLLRVQPQQCAVDLIGEALSQNIRPHVDRVRALVAHGLGGFRWGSTQKFNGSFFEHSGIVIPITSAA